MPTREQLLEKVERTTQASKLNEIILFNDDVNTFDFVIEMLVNVCDHTPIQAEQCAIIVHFKGKCSVKTGTFDELEPRCTKLLEAGLSAEII